MSGIKIKLNIDNINFIEEREKMLLKVAEIFQIPSEVIEKPFVKGDGVEWRSVMVKREVEIIEGHEGMSDFELEESATGWGNRFISPGYKRVKGYRVSPEAFVQALTTQTIGELKWTKIIRGIPPGADVLGATFELASRCWIVYVEHESFPEIETGVRAPLCEIVLHEMNFEGLIARLKAVQRLVEEKDDATLSTSVRLHLKAIMKMYFPEETTEL